MSYIKLCYPVNELTCFISNENGLARCMICCGTPEVATRHTKFFAQEYQLLAVLCHIMFIFFFK